MTQSSSPAAPPRISVLIVTYNSAAHLRPTLEHLFAQDDPAFEAILLDNASADDSLAIAREFAPRGLRVIAGAVNLGFAGGNNAAAAQAHPQSEILFLLNPDAWLQPGALRELARAFAENPRAGIVGGKLLFGDGVTLQHCGGVVGLPAHCAPIGRGERDAGQHDAPQRVEYVIGAALAIRRTLWDQLRGLDEAYNPAYYEDTDLCARARAAGWDVLYWPPLRVIHQENVSLEYMSPAYWRLMQTNRLRYTLRHHSLTALLFKALPAEWRWFWHKDMRSLRRSVLGVYGRTARRLLRSMLGLRERPPDAAS